MTLSPIFSALLSDTRKRYYEDGQVSEGHPTEQVCVSLS